MGFGAKAEYTLELLREPQRYNHITHQFMCTGFVLATGLDESALEFLLNDWQWIDSVTSDRVRFLFFVDNETDLHDYPKRPRFSVDAYQRYHQRLLQQASGLGFEVKVAAGKVVDYDRGELVRPWQPDEKVRRLSRELGVASLLPCIVWSFDRTPNTIFARSIEGLDGSQIAQCVSEFCKKFYQLNTPVLHEIESVEQELEDLCGSLEITVGDLSVASELSSDLNSISVVLRDLHNIEFAQDGRMSQIKNLHDAASQLAKVGAVAEDPPLAELTGRIRRWARTCLSMQSFLGRQRYLRFTKVRIQWRKSLNVDEVLPEIAARPSPPDFQCDRKVLNDLVDRVSTLFPNHKAAISLLKWQGKLESAEDSKRPQYLASLALGALFLVRDAVRVGHGNFLDFPEAERVERAVEQHFAATTHACSVSIQLWLYYQMDAVRKKLLEQIQRGVGFADKSEVAVGHAVSRAQQLVDRISALSQSFRLPEMKEYGEFSVESIPRQFPRTSANKCPESNVEVVRNLCENAVGLLPIQLAMQGVHPVPSVLEYVQEVESQLHANAAGQALQCESLLAGIRRLVKEQTTAIAEQPGRSEAIPIIQRTPVNTIKILFLSANPRTTDSLAIDEEVRAIQQCIRASHYRDSLVLIPKLAAQPEDVMQALLEHKPQVVHFSAHGNEVHELLLTGDRGEDKAVNVEALQMLFSTLKDNVRVVVFNACFAHAQADAVAEVIDCAIGMNDEISDEAAIAFSGSFYRALGFGRSVQEAFDLGKVAIMLDGAAEEHVPKLVSREGVCASEVLLIESVTAEQSPPLANRGIVVGRDVVDSLFITGEGNQVSETDQQ